MRKNNNLDNWTYWIGNDPDNCLECQQGYCGYHGGHEETYGSNAETKNETGKTICDVCGASYGTEPYSNGGCDNPNCSAYRGW